MISKIVHATVRHTDMNNLGLYTSRGHWTAVRLPLAFFLESAAAIKPGVIPYYDSKAETIFT